MAGGHADDLASTVLMATDKPVLVAPAMNPRMWLHPATQRNVAQLQDDGIRFVGPNAGEMAERDEAGPGRMAEVPEIIAAASEILAEQRDAPAARLRAGRLPGRHVLVTSGPTHEPIDPVRYIANRSSGKQGHAIARAAAALGARVTLVTGPGVAPDPAGRRRRPRRDGRARCWRRCRRRFPADIAVFAAAVADWRVGDRRRARRSRRPATSAAPRSGREPGHPGDGRQVARAAAARSSSALRPRRATSSSKPRKKRKSQGRRLDRRQRRVAGDAA